MRPPILPINYCCYGLLLPEGFGSNHFLPIHMKPSPSQLEGNLAPVAAFSRLLLRSAACCWCHGGWKGDGWIVRGTDDCHEGGKLLEAFEGCCGLK